MIKDTLARKRIFSIEDDTEQILILTNTLAFYNASFLYEPWGGDIILDLVKHLPLDMILLDLMLPKEATGYKVFADIRAHPLLSKIPVVAVSALDSATEIPKLKAAGFSGFIPKPADLEKLADYLVDVLNGKKIWIS